MSKTEKRDGVATVAEVRRTPAPDPRPGRVGKGRGRNFEAADASMRDRLAQGRRWLEGFLPENEGVAKAKMRELRAKKCECGHRGDKHFSRRFWRPGLEAHPCKACGGKVCPKFKEAAA